MTNANVRLTRLENMRVASLHGFGTEPELQAWEKLVNFAGARGYLKDLAHHRIFGFNNPDPTPGSPNYGYELWITVESGGFCDRRGGDQRVPGRAIRGGKVRGKR